MPGVMTERFVYEYQLSKWLASTSPVQAYPFHQNEDFWIVCSFKLTHTFNNMSTQCTHTVHTHPPPPSFLTVFIQQDNGYSQSFDPTWCFPLHKIRGQIVRFLSRLCTCEGLTTLITEALICGRGQPAIFMIIYSTSIALFITKMNMQNKQELNNTSIW